MSNHNKDQLKYWRANVDFSIVHDFTKVQRYVAKYASKGETRSGVFKEAFKTVFSEASEDRTNTKVALRRVMTKVLGERDIESCALTSFEVNNIANCKKLRLIIVSCFVLTDKVFSPCI